MVFQPILVLVCFFAANNRTLERFDLFGERYRRDVGTGQNLLFAEPFRQLAGVVPELVVLESRL